MRPVPSVRRRRCRWLLRKLALEPLEDRRLLAVIGEAAPGGLFSQLAIDPGVHREAALLVQFRADASAAAVSGTQLGRGWEIAPGLREVSVQPGTDYLAALAAYKEHPDVLFVEPDFRVTLNVLPSDPAFDLLYGLDNQGQTGGTPDADIDAPEAWDVTTGSHSVVVAVIDTGVDYSHPDLYRNIWINQDEIPSAIRANLADIDGDGRITFVDLNDPVNQGAGKITDLNANGRIDGGDLIHNSSGWENGQDNGAGGRIDDLIGWNFVTNTNDPRDDHFPGTHVAGTIGAVGDNGVGVAGVNWNVQIMPLKFLDSSGGGFTSDAIAALNFAVANGATISNNSWGGDSFSAAFQTALVNAAAAGHIFVAAAGNDGGDNDAFPFYPAGYEVDNVVSVAASDHNDQFAWFSNVGATTVDLAAPGVDIYSTFPTYTTGEMSAGGFSRNYETISGTSMATPHVAGALALVRALHPEWTFDQVVGQLLGTVDVVEALGQTITGGRLNAAAAVGNPPPDTTAPRIIGSDPAGGVTGDVSQVRLRFSEPIDPASFDASDIASFDGPAGAIAVSAVLPVAGSSRQFDVTFASQSAEGSYSLVVGPDILDLAGNAMAAPHTVSFSIVDTLIFNSSDVPAPIFDWTAVGSYLDVDQSVTIGDINVRLDITHTYDGDLAIYLISPSGNYTFLSYFYGGAGNDFDNTLFDDEAATPIWSGTAPFAGSYQPDTPLATFDGENTVGTWQLWIEDWGFFDEGTLNSWSIEITPSGSSPPPPPPPPPEENQPPYAEYDYVQGLEDTPLTISTAELLANDYDPDGDPLSVIAVGDAYGGTAALAGGTITFTPDPDFNSDYNGYAYFSYTIADGRGGESVGWVDVDLVAVNDAPVAVDDALSGTSDAPIFVQGWELAANDFDVDGDWLQVVAVGGAFGGTVGLDEWEQITFTPDLGYVGFAGFTYTISDGLTTATANVTIDLRAYYHFSLTDPATLVNSDGSTLNVRDNDIVRLTVSGGGEYRYSLYFDASDVGLTTAGEDIDAFTILSDGTILISTVGAFNVPSYGSTLMGTSRDILAFYPYSLGNQTSGDWWLYLAGSDVGLSAASENIDALAELPNGSLVISTTGNVSVPGASGVDADLLRYDYVQWRMYFDASDVGLTTAEEDIDALFVRPDPTGGPPDLLLSTRGNFDVAGASGANDDVLAFAPTRLGGITAGSFSVAFVGAAYGLAALDIDGMYIGATPNDWMFASASSSSLSSTAAKPFSAAEQIGAPFARGEALLQPLVAEAVLPPAAASGGIAAPRLVLAPAAPSPAAVDFVLAAWAARQKRGEDAGPDATPSKRDENQSPPEDVLFSDWLQRG